MRFIFQHGWGLNKNFWLNLAPFFTKYECIFLDSGYFGDKIDLIVPNDNIRNIGIGHSFGFAKLVSMKDIKWEKLISISGFNKFINKPKTLKTLNYIKDGIAQDTKKTLLMFYQLCGVQDEFWRFFLKSSVPNKDLLLNDLDLLAKINILVPDNVLHLVGDCDVILDTNNMIDAKNIVFPNIGHQLGYKHADWVFEQIKDYL